MSIRTEKVASVIQRALARPLSDFAHEVGAGLVTVTHVRMSPDLRVAKVYLSIFGGKKVDAKQAIMLLEARTKAIRRDVVPKLGLRFAPELKFFIDDTLEIMERVDSLLKKIPKYSEESDHSEPPHEHQSPNDAEPTN